MDARWDDLKTVLEVARGKTLAAAADALGLNYTTVARRIARAEGALGQKLFERLADGYRATEAGQLIARHAAAMEEAEHRMMREMLGRDGALAGPLTVTAPQVLVAHVLGPVLKQFLEEHPGVDLTINGANDLLDLSRREADLAIRVSRNPGDALTGLRLVQQESAVFATPDWADRIATDPAGPVDWLIYKRFRGIPADAVARLPGSRIRMRFDDIAAIAGAAQAGLGVVRLPCFLGRATPGLVELPMLPALPLPDIWVVGHPDVWPGVRPTAFRTHLLRHLKTRRDDFLSDRKCGTPAPG